ncbi:hexapeptide transferase [Agaricicola taiwanensis]|uniref:Hexapeptide transferase n=1 Tax=Agaricicola taiwanensis TaxID=591372 RepID=A0A8J2VNX9_9RHOB|nr:hexapeptide transferase [Agaricicola taiwanensis]
MRVCLVGAGGHAKVVTDGLREAGHTVAVYCDPQKADWLDAEWIEKDSDLQSVADLPFVLGLGGVTPDGLLKRVTFFEKLAQGREMPAIIHPRAMVSPSATVEDGAHIMPGAIINAEAHIGRFTIINSGAIVEHDSVIEAGAHIAPGAIVLGGGYVGAYAMIGAGAVVLPQQAVRAHGFVRAASLAPRTS